jgi:hypothetical protein
MFCPSGALTVELTVVDDDPGKSPTGDDLAEREPALARV